MGRPNDRRSADNAPEGFIVEADIEYQEQLHDLHNDYPLAPETIPILEKWLNPFQCDLADELGGKLPGFGKLVPNLQRYVVH